MTTKEKTRASGASQHKRRTPDVVYTQPKPFRRDRFLLHMVTVVAVVLALVLGMAIFFKVKEVRVSGTDKYSAWDVKEASGIQDGDHLLTLSKAKIGGRIIKQLPYVKSVRIGIKLPDTINIELEMLTVFYAIEAEDGQWWKMAADGKVVDMITAAEAAGLTKVVGVQIANPQPGMKAVAAEAEPETETTEATETATATEDTTEVTIAPPVTVYGSERLEAALKILTQLEKNTILGEMTVVDVTDINAMVIWRGEYFRVSLGDTSRMDEKILAVRVYMDENGRSNAGELDVSFTIWSTPAFTPSMD